MTAPAPGTCVHGVAFAAECWDCVPVENRAAHAGRVAEAYYRVVAAADDFASAVAARMPGLTVDDAKRRLLTAVQHLRRLEGRA